MVFSLFKDRQVSVLPRRYGKKEQNLNPVITVVNLLIGGVVLLLVFFIFRHVTDDTPAESSRTSPTSPTSPGSPPSAPRERAANEIFFADDLFIGDSIMTGIQLYGYIPAANVFAKNGLNPRTVQTERISEQSVFEKAADMQPERVYVMLGSNGIGFHSPAQMLPWMVDFMSELETAAPGSEIFLLTIPPVTAAHEEKGVETMENINAFNALLRQAAAENSYNLIDFGVTLKDSTGYFAEDYAEADGLHFKPAAYVKMLDYIQDAIINEDFVFIPD